MGQLIYLFEFQTALSGELYGIDAFDQPGVEAGKVATYALMRRKGYVEEARRLRADLARPRAII
jgi:glucose-6-phosphate isomerase